MHELSIASAVVNTACRHAGDRPVSTVSVRTGRLRQVVAESLQFYFEIVARDTVCERARLALTEVPVRLRCDDCARQWAPEIPAFRCPACGSADVKVLSGEELEVEFIELEEMEATCTGPR
jgi:hydrogenase nickel incorporation protein HypA/HybF